MRNICICGGGSLGTVCAGVMASKGYIVNLLTGHPLNWNKRIEVADNTGNLFVGNLNIISDKAEKVIPDSDLILLCVPAYLIEKILKQIKPFVKENTIIGSIVANTGFFFKAHEIFSSSQPLFSFQRVPFISRYKEYGRSAELLGYKPVLKVATENIDNLHFKETLENLFITPVEFLSNFYEASLSNSNPILHTGRLFSMWQNYQGERYEKPILFYSEWTDEASRIVLDMDKEFIELRDKLGISDLAIPSLKKYYEVENPEEFTNKIKSIPAFDNIEAPLKKEDNFFIPDFNSRYFTEDFSFGLQMIKNLADQYYINTPNIDRILRWGLKMITQNENRDN